MPASAATVNTTLTNYAQGFAQDRNLSLADFIAPEVPTGVSSGQYKRYASKNDFVVYNTGRAIGGGRTRIEFAADDPYFNCRPQGLEIAIDDHERKQAGDTGVMNLQQAKIRTLLNAQIVGHEHKVWTALRAAVSAVGGGVGAWSDDAVDPIEEMDAQIEAITTATGMMPNRIAMGLGAWRVLKNHVLVRNRLADSSDKNLSYDRLAGMLLNPNIEIRVGVMSYDTAKTGKTANNVNVVGSDVWIFTGSQAPDQYDPSFAKTFTTVSGFVGGVREYRDEGAVSDVYPVDWDEDIVVTATASGRRITLS